MTDIKVIHIITRLEPGGSAQNVIDSAVFQAEDRKVILISGPNSGRERLKLELPENAQYLEIADLVREISPIRDIKAFFAIKKIISAIRPAIVHTHTSKAGILGRWAAWLHNLTAGRPDRAVVIHTPHGHVFYGYFDPVKTFIFTAVERLTARITDRFIALTKGERDESIAHGLGTADKWTIIHSGIRFQARTYDHARRGLDIPAADTVIAVVARLEPVKGVEYFIRAAAELKAKYPEKRLRFLIIGDGALLTRLLNLSNSLGLRDAITFAGFQQDVFKYLAAADIYAQPSLNEAMGRTVIEAQYMGLPVVASRVCGLPDALKEGVTGMLTPPGDPEALAAALGTLITDVDLRRRMGSSAREWISQKDATGQPHFSVESMNIRLKTFYNKVLEEYSARRAGY